MKRQEAIEKILQDVMDNISAWEEFVCDCVRTYLNNELGIDELADWVGEPVVEGDEK